MNLLQNFHSLASKKFKTTKIELDLTGRHIFIATTNRYTIYVTNGWHRNNKPAINLFYKKRGNRGGFNSYFIDPQKALEFVENKLS